MSYHETDCNLCKSCYVKIKKPSKRNMKKMGLTSYKDECENCGSLDRLVDYIWNDDEEEEIE